MYGSMDVPNQIISLGLIFILLIVVAMVFVMQVKVTRKYKLNERITGGAPRESTYFLDEGEDEKKCEICYGKIESDTIAECKCGKVFHDACAAPTGSCPYCGTIYAQMTKREPVRARCPVCGRYVKGGMCECGAVLPRKDDTFLCSCGNRVDASKPVCKKCGAVYESTSMQIFKRK